MANWYWIKTDDQNQVRKSIEESSDIGEAHYSTIINKMIKNYTKGGGTGG